MRYRVGAEVRPHTDTNFEEDRRVRITQVLRGIGKANSWVTGLCDSSKNSVMVQDLARPVEHSAVALTSRAVAIWDVSGYIASVNR